MREINNNSSNLNFSGIQKLNHQKDNQSDAFDINPSDNSELPESSDLSQMPTAVIGRSLISKSDSVDNDVKFMMKNPDLCANANKFFDIAEEQSNYENAAKLMDGFVKEFQK